MSQDTYYQLHSLLIWQLESVTPIKFGSSNQLGNGGIGCARPLVLNLSWGLLF